MKDLSRQIIPTADGSHTLYVPALDEHYHSVHGAIQESNHVFIEAGLKQLIHLPEINVFEVGFGTGLNAFLTLKYALENRIKINYQAIEKYPLLPAEFEALNFTGGQNNKEFQQFLMLHQSPWEKWIAIEPNFRLYKIEGSLEKSDFEGNIHLVYFDAFAPDKQSELWSDEIFSRLFNKMAAGGILVTYCAKGQVRRNLQSAGFKTERIPGPPGKREMLRARKPG